MNNFKLAITTSTLNLISEIDEFKGAWKLFESLSPEKLDGLKKVATIESIGSSTRIEGSKLSDQEVQELLAGLKTHSFQSRDEEEVAGLGECLNLIFDSYADISLSINHIKQLHKTLLKYSKKDTRHAGNYKKLSNNVGAFDKDGKMIGIIFETATPFDTARLTEELVLWTNEAFESRELHPLLVIAVFIVHFLAIHPFQDGNGRLSRTLTTLLLLRLGYNYIPYVSLESIIEINKNTYYAALRKAQVTITTSQYDIEPWVNFFLKMLVTHKNRLNEKISTEKAMAVIPELSANILILVKSRGRLTLTEATMATGKNKRTVKAHIAKLVKDRYLQMQGAGKSTFYTLNN